MLRFGLPALALLFTSGCDAAGALALKAIGLDVPEAAASRVGVYPADGTMAWRGAFEVRVFLKDPLDIDQLQVLVDTPEGTLEPACWLDALGQAVCPIANAIPEDQDFEIEVRVNGASLHSSATSRVPEPGRSFRFSEGLVVEHAGASEDAAGILENLLANNELAAVLTNGQDGALLFGAADYWEDGVISLDEPGLTMPLPLKSRESGVFETEVVDGFLPFRNGDEIAQVRLLDASATGFVDGDGLHYELEGVLAGEGLDTLAAVLELPSSSLYALLAPDEDLDGDGEPESVRIAIRGDSPESPLRAWTEE